MSSVYQNCPEYENENFKLRFVMKSDSSDLLDVYSDKNALPFFNSDNCHGDNFYYSTMERMDAAIDFWHDSYKEKWFVRWAIIDKTSSKAIGTIELFHRIADDDFNHVGVLRLDLRSDYGFQQSNRLLIGSNDHYAYKDYWTKNLEKYMIEVKYVETKNKDFWYSSDEHMLEKD